MPLPTQIGRFKVSRQLGAGAMGAVFLARHPGLDQEVALKVLHDRDPELVARFRREAEIMARIKDPGVVEVYEAGVHEGQLFLAMEYVPGQDLAERLKERGALPPAEALALVAEVARAVEAAHQAGVIHRDLKPANILLDAAGRPKVTDFGISARAGAGRHSLTETGVLLGTPAYMAPEQATDAREVDARCDVYALGAILHECLSGRRAFSGPSGLAVLAAVMEGDAAPLPSGLPEGVVEVVRVAMALDPGDRYSSAGLLNQALDEALQGVGQGPGRHGAGVVRFVVAAAVLALFGGLAGWALLEATPSPSVAASPSVAPVAVVSRFPQAGSERYFSDKRRLWRVTEEELRAQAKEGHPAAKTRLVVLALRGRLKLRNSEVGALLLSAAEAGDSEAMFLLGAWAKRNRGFDVGPRDWIQEAASRGSGVAVLTLGGSVQEAEAAVVEAAALGDPSAHALLIETAISAGDPSKALERLGAGVALGVDSFRPIRGRLLREARDHAGALSDFTAAMEAGLPEGTCGVARAYALGLGVERDLTKARQLIRAASELGYRLALFEEVYVAETREERVAALEGLESLRASGVPTFLWGEVGLYLFAKPNFQARSAALLHDARPMTATDPRVPLRLGIMILQGEAEARGLDPMKLFERAEALGHPEGFYARADCILLGRGAPLDVPRGLRLLEEAGRAGSVLAWNRLGAAYSGRLRVRVETDPTRALACYLKAAEGGYSPAMLSAALALLERGDQARGRRWTLRGARALAQESADRQVELKTYGGALEFLAEHAFASGKREEVGRWCALGRAERPPRCLSISARLERSQPSPDWKQVADWYRRGHEAGEGEGRFGFARCLARGLGVRGDLGRAKKLIAEGQVKYPHHALVEEVGIALQAGDLEALGPLLQRVLGLGKSALSPHEWGDLGLELWSASSTQPADEGRALAATAVFCFKRTVPLKSLDPRVPFVAAELLERGVLKLTPGQNRNQALNAWYRRAGALGHPTACQRLGERWISGEGIRKDVPAGLDALRKAGSLGGIKAWELLGDLYCEGLGEELAVDFVKAKAAYLAGAEACRANQARPAFAGRLYAKLGALLSRRGEFKEAVAWFGRGLALKAPLAEIGYAGCLLSGRGVEVDTARALALLEPHTDSYLLACEVLADAFREGVGVEVDLERAKDYEAKAKTLRAAGAERWPSTD